MASEVSAAVPLACDFFDFSSAEESPLAVCSEDCLLVSTASTSTAHVQPPGSICRDNAMSPQTLDELDDACSDESWVPAPNIYSGLAPSVPKRMAGTWQGRLNVHCCSSNDQPADWRGLGSKRRIISLSLPASRELLKPPPLILPEYDPNCIDQQCQFTPPSHWPVPPIPPLFSAGFPAFDTADISGPVQPANGVDKQAYNPKDFVSQKATPCGSESCNTRVRLHARRCLRVDRYGSPATCQSPLGPADTPVAMTSADHSPISSGDEGASRMSLQDWLCHMEMQMAKRQCQATHGGYLLLPPAFVPLKILSPKGASYAG
eukprot:jgi/Chrzof1/15154/Cz09g29100.t1